MKDYNAYLLLIEARLRECAAAKDPDTLRLPIRYTLEGGGKRLRPILMMASCEAAGRPADQILNQAAAIEMFHNFTLLHDDVMDRADMRRGRATVHRRWDERQAILSGDAMLTMATQLLADGCPPQLLSDALALFNATAMEVYDGQQLDMEFETRQDVTIDEYMRMIRLKTSVLLGCAAAMGALLAEAARPVVKAFYQFGVNLGMAFQLQDDLLDTYGDPIVFGKEIGGDIVNDKKTWLRITAMTEDTSGIISAETTSPTPDKIERVRAVYTSLSLPERCRELIDRYTDAAIAALAPVAIPRSALDFFTALADSARTRTH
ncbi:MAG: polyprenyl synthetase family protein [Pseudoflavonifractor sp.]|nr:polyprenyl synthetase family protein [Alloprevotella sp.]MCM1116792.1 polyprenyl synthetase family protein [Pseudoflavonifractor sp.]